MTPPSTSSDLRNEVSENKESCNTRFESTNHSTEYSAKCPSLSSIEGPLNLAQPNPIYTILNSASVFGVTKNQ